MKQISRKNMRKNARKNAIAVTYFGYASAKERRMRVLRQVSTAVVTLCWLAVFSGMLLAVTTMLFL